VPGAFSLGSFELVESAPNCPAVDAELVGNVCLALTSMNARAYPLDVQIGKFGCGSHPKSLLRWDISRDITKGSRKSREMDAIRVNKPKKSALEPNRGSISEDFWLGESRYGGSRGSTPDYKPFQRRQTRRRTLRTTSPRFSFDRCDDLSAVGRFINLTSGRLPFSVAFGARR
jgi:hypothetical protein